MWKKIFIITLFTFVSTVSSFAFDYWFLDVHVEDFVESLSDRPTTQRIFFFKDLRSFQQATSQNNFNWSNQTRRLFRYEEILYERMRVEGFTHAFILIERGVPRNPREPNYWIYRGYTFINGQRHADIFTREVSPIRF